MTPRNDLSERLKTLLGTPGEAVFVSGKPVAHRVPGALVAEHAPDMCGEAVPMPDVVFVAEHASLDGVVDLASGLAAKVDRGDIPETWIAIQEGPLAETLRAGVKSEPGQPLTLGPKQRPLRFATFSPDQVLGSRRARLARAERPAFEATGNLGRRAEWFKRRSGD